MAAHSKIGASSMYRWASCPGSVKLSEGIESVSSAYAAEGTIAHDIASQILLGANPSVPVDFDGMDAVGVYVTWAKEVSKDADKVLVEHKFDLSSLYPGMFGTGDLVVLKGTRLIIADYKHGQGIPVEVLEDGKPNMQLLYYALGAMIDTGFKVEQVELVVVQPRCYHPDGPVRSHVFDALELLDFAADLVEAAKRTEDPNAPLKSGDHCRFCPAAPKCPELRKKALEVAQREFAPTFSYDPVQLADTLNQLPALEAFIKSVREFAYREAEHGRCPPGWKLVQKRATRRWKDSEDTTLAKLKSLITETETLFERKLKSPAQVEKMIGKAGKKHIEELVVAESSGYNLAPETDSRPSIANDAAAVFKTIETT